MAITLLEFHGKNPDTKLVILAGDGHSWKHGIPRQVSRRRDLPMTVFLPETPKLHRGNATRQETDYLWISSFDTAI